jgi:hypothetical protein
MNARKRFPDRHTYFWQNTQEYEPTIVFYVRHGGTNFRSLTGTYFWPWLLAQRTLCSKPKPVRSHFSFIYRVVRKII